MDKDYQKYKLECESLGSQPLSEEEYITGDVKFMPPGPAVSGLAGNILTGLAQNFASRLTKGESIAPALRASLIEEGFKVGANISPEAIRITLGDKFNSSSGSSGGGNSPSSTESNSGNSNNLLGSFQTNSVNIDLNTNINSRVYCDPYNYPINGRTSYLHLTNSRLSFKDASDYIKQFTSQVLIPYLQNKAQLSVNFMINVSTISYENVRDYLDLVAEALQVYYFYTSVVSYTSIPNNPDRGMFALRAMISADDLDYLSQLRMLLRALPIPPNLNKMCFFLMQTFCDGPSSQGLVKFMPIPFNANYQTNTVTGFGGTNSSVLTSLITRISNANTSGIVPLLTRILPTWVSEDIMDPAPVPVYSADFLTVWGNAPYCLVGNGVVLYGPLVDNANEMLTSYNSFSPNPDGFVIGLGSACVSPSAGTSFNNLVWVNNLLKMVPTSSVWSGSTYFANRASFIQTSSGTFEFQFSNNQIEAAFGRPESRRVNGYVAYFSRPADTYNIANVNANLFNFVGRDLVTWMLSLDSIKGKTEKKYFDSTRPSRG